MPEAAATVAVVAMVAAAFTVVAAFTVAASMGEAFEVAVSTSAEDTSVVAMGSPQDLTLPRG
jgi:hypothetical protein